MFKSNKSKIIGIIIGVVVLLIIVLTLLVRGAFLIVEYRNDSIRDTLNNNQDILNEVNDRVSDIEEVEAIFVDTETTVTTLEQYSNELKEVQDYIRFTAIKNIEEGDFSKTEEIYDDYIDHLELWSGHVEEVIIMSDTIKCHATAFDSINTTLDELNASTFNSSEPTPLELADDFGKSGREFNKVSREYGKLDTCNSEELVQEILKDIGIRSISEEYEESTAEISSLFLQIEALIRSESYEEVQAFTEKLDVANKKFQESETKGLDQLYDEMVKRVENNDEVLEDSAREINSKVDDIEESL